MAIAVRAPLTAMRNRLGSRTVAQEHLLHRRPLPWRPLPRRCPLPRFYQLHRPAHPLRGHHLLLLMGMASEHGSPKLILMPSSRISTIRLAPGRTSSHTMRWFRQQQHSLTLPTRVTPSTISWSLQHSWARRAMRQQGDGRQHQVDLKRGATASRKSVVAKAVLARATVLRATHALTKASIALARQDRRTKAVDLCSSVGTTTMLPSVTTSMVTQQCSSTSHRGLQQTQLWRSNLGFGSG